MRTKLIIFTLKFARGIFGDLDLILLIHPTELVFVAVIVFIITSSLSFASFSFLVDLMNGESLLGFCQKHNTAYIAYVII